MAVVLGRSTESLDVIGGGVPFYYFAKVPSLPPEVQHQSNAVEVVEYLAREGAAVQPGTPLLRVANWWAEMELDSVSRGFLAKTFFDPGTRVLIGDPFAIIHCDGEDAPGKSPTAGLRVTRTLREKPRQ